MGRSIRLVTLVLACAVLLPALAFAQASIMAFSSVGAAWSDVLAGLAGFLASSAATRPTTDTAAASTKAPAQMFNFIDPPFWNWSRQGSARDI